MADVGIMIEGQDGLNWDIWKKVAKTVEESGYQCLFRSDHYTNSGGDIKDALELWTSLTWLADHTERIEFGPLVTPITFRHPAMTAQHAVAVDSLSNGRLVLGMGTGWQDREHEAYDIYFPDLSERYEMLEDGLEVVTRLITADEPTSYDGKHYSLKDAMLTMKRKGSPKMLIGGNGPKKTMPLAAKYASEWNAVFIDRETYKERYAHMHDLLDAEGKRADDYTFSLMTRVIYGKDDATLAKKLESVSKSKAELQDSGIIVGVGDEIVSQVNDWAALGVERFMLQWIETDDIDGIAHMAHVLLPNV